MHDGQINLNITAPKSWRELSQDELRYTLFLLTRFQEPLTVKTYLFCRLAGIEIIKHTRTGWKCSVLCRVDGKSRPKPKVIYLETEIVLSLLSQFDFIDGFDNFQPLQAISGLKAVTSIRKITFQDYLFSEKYYQLYLMHKEDKFLQQLGYLLYRDEDGKRDDSVNFTAEELLGTFFMVLRFQASGCSQFPSLLQKYEGGRRADHGGYHHGHTCAGQSTHRWRHHQAAGCL